MNTAFGEQLVIADERIEMETALHLSTEEAQNLAELAVYHDEARLAQEAEDLRLAIRLSGQQDADAADEDEVVNRAITNSFDEHDAFVAEKDERRRREVIHEYCAQQTVDTAPNVLGGPRPAPRAFRASASVHVPTPCALRDRGSQILSQRGKSRGACGRSRGARDPDCSICLHPVVDPRALECHHVFCANRINHWLNMNKICPDPLNPLDQARRLGIPFTSFRNVKARIAATTNQSVQSSTEAVFSATNVVVTDAAVPSADAAVGTIDVVTLTDFMTLSAGAVPTVVSFFDADAAARQEAFSTN
ncbi:hypothetical protein PC116_g5086 [Phytophthora cactorum]|nr:hypothetical protein PC116_g5086 [Phytophthora cactorum]